VNGGGFESLRMEIQTGSLEVIGPFARLWTYDRPKQSRPLFV